MSKTIEEAALYWFTHNPLGSSMCYRNAFIAGANHVISEAMEGFDEWYISTDSIKCIDVVGNRTFTMTKVRSAWAAAKLSSVKEIAEKDAEIKELERKNEALMLRQLEDDHKITELRDGLEWTTALLRERPDVMGQYGRYKVEEIRTKHNLKKMEG